MALREIVSRLFRKTPQKKESEGAGVLSQKDYDAKYGKYILARGILGDKKLELIDFRNVKRKILGGLHYFHLLEVGLGKQRGEGEVKIPVIPMNNKADLYIDPSMGWQFEDNGLIEGYGVVYIKVTKGDAATGQKVAVQALSKKR